MVKTLPPELLCEMKVKKVSGGNCLVDDQDKQSVERACETVTKDLCFTGSDINIASFIASGCNENTIMQVEKVKIENITFRSIIDFSDLSQQERCDLAVEAGVAYKWATITTDPCTVPY